MRWSTLLCCALLVAAAPQELRAQEGRVPIPTAALPPEMDRVLRDYEAAWTGGDAARLASLFHSDGFVLSSGSNPVRGRAAIQAHYRDAGSPLRLRALAWGASDTIGYIVGAFSGNSGREGGKFLLALRRANARAPWLIAADMDNTNSRRE